MELSKLAYQCAILQSIVSWIVFNVKNRWQDVYVSNFRRTPTTCSQMTIRLLQRENLRIVGNFSNMVLIRYLCSIAHNLSLLKSYGHIVIIYLNLFFWCLKKLKLRWHNALLEDHWFTQSQKFMFKNQDGVLCDNS